MLANIPVSEIRNSSTLKGAPVSSSTRIPNINHSVTNSILALFELAVLETPDTDLVRHIRHVIAVKRAAIAACQQDPS